MVGTREGTEVTSGHDRAGSGGRLAGVTSVTTPNHSGSIGELFWRVSEAVVLLDGDRIIAWNPSAVRMFGIDPQQGVDAQDVFSDALGPAYEQLQMLLKQSGTAVIDAVES